MHENHRLATHEAARAELQAVLLSAWFQRSPRLSALLSYLCSKALAGEADQLKEYTIGVEVLGRPETFDPTEDAGARVEIHRLRKRLADFYKDEGAAHSVRIQIPSGQYAPLFLHVEPVKPVLPAAPVELAATPPAPEVKSEGRGWKIWALVLALAGLGVLIPVFASFRKSPPPIPVALPPAAVNHPESSVRIACGRLKPYTDRWGQRWEQDV